MMELLAPAGYWEAMTAAVQNGADAVYLGCGGWNARRGAKNFSEEELPEAVKYCHLRGVKVYLTLNTLLSDRELPEAEHMLRLASRCGVDAVIVQDWGALALAREVVPDLPLHGSTQMTVHSLDGVKQAAKLGMKCVVLGRELDRENIRFICQNSPIAIEVFGHGALCMCWSGQCAMSALIGGRSGNRGLCAQPCRLPYGFDGGKMGRPLSLKDACLGESIPELMEMGVSVLKLEGRMKRPEYVAVVTRVYAGLIRENRTPTKKEMRELFREAKDAYERETMRRVPVKMEAEIRAGKPAQLCVTDGDGNSVCAVGPVAEAARSKPLEMDGLKARFGKTGGTVFEAASIHVTVDGGLSLPVSGINGMRRDALEKLEQCRTVPPVRREVCAEKLERCASTANALSYTVSLARGSQLTREIMRHKPSVAYVPVERIDEFDLKPYLDGECVFCAALTRICKDSELPELTVLLQKAKSAGCLAVEVQNIGQLELAVKSGLALRGGSGLNVFNSRSLRELKNWGLTSAVVSFEMRYQQIRDLIPFLPCEALVYGRLPLMITENCLVRNALSCKESHLKGCCRKSHELRDRRGEVFPVMSVFGCRSEIQNSKVLFLADQTDWRKCGLAFGRLRFTTEQPDVCADVLRQYLEGEAERPAEFTRGLFYRGVD